MKLIAFLFRKRLEEKEVLGRLLRKVGRIKDLEGKCSRLEKAVREAATDRNRLATRIQKLEHKEKKRQNK